MNKQELIDKLTEVSNYFENSNNEYCITFKTEHGAITYRACCKLLDDLIKDVKENLVDSLYIKDDNLYKEVKQGLDKRSWSYKSVASGFGKGSFYLEFSNPILGNFKIHSHQFNILRSLLECLQEEDLNLYQQMWNKFLVVYKQESCSTK